MMKYSTNNGFGLLLPDKTQHTIVHKSGGVAITYPQFTGCFVPLHKPIRTQIPTKYINSNSEFPESGLQISEIDESERDTIPVHIQERGYFENWFEFKNWVDKRPWAYRNWIRVLRAWNYDYKGNILGYDLRQHWESTEQIWNKIDSTLPFTYDVISPTFTVETQKRTPTHEEEQKLTEKLPSNQPLYGEGIRWMEITGTKQPYKHTSFADFTDLIGQKVCLLYPNCD